MTDLYLIAHKVRGEAAFDVATQMKCPLCNGYPYGGYPEDLDNPCHECDGLGYWWIIPTSGHRAYPWWSAEINSLAIVTDKLNDMPPNTPDHYPTTTPTKGPTLAERLGLTKVVGKITRRL